MLWTLTGALASAAAVGAPLPTDVAAKHWAASSVRAVLDAGVMAAPGGRFGGATSVTRDELIGVLARTARALEQRKWPGGEPRAVREGKRPANWKTAAVSRYRLAAVLARVVPLALAGLPPRNAARRFNSETIPKAPSLKGVPRNSPAYRDLEYLAGRRMVWPGSALLKPGKQTVTGEQLSIALAQMIAGLNGGVTDEPQNMPEVTRPPR
jgi:hypothetical protein